MQALMELQGEETSTTPDNGDEGGDDMDWQDIEPEGAEEPVTHAARDILGPQ
jgi:hypothetical protein